MSHRNPAALSTGPGYTKGESDHRGVVAAAYGYARVHQLPKRCSSIDSTLKCLGNRTRLLRTWLAPGARRLFGGNRAVLVASLAQGPDQVVELVARARRLGGEGAAIMGIDRRLQRLAARYLDAGFGQTLELRRVVGHQQHARAAEHLQHARRDAVIALVVVEAKRGVGLDRIEARILQRIGADLVGKPEAAAFLLEIEDDAAALFIQPRQRKPKLIAAVATARAEHIAGEASRVQPHWNGL